MTRIIAGHHGGRRLGAPSGRDTRPTSDRVREALFSALEARIGLAQARVVDLYAGSGAIGLEAHSRGASHVLLVESAARAARTVRQNIAALGAGGAVRLAVERAEKVVAERPDAPYDIVFADPPYTLAAARLAEVLAALVVNGWLADEALVVIERSSRDAAFEWVPGITADGVRRYGETALWYGRRS